MKSASIAAALLLTALTVPTLPLIAADFSAQALGERTVQRRAVEAAMWGMPMVSVDAMRETLWEVPVSDIGPAGDDQGKGGKYLLIPPVCR